MRNPERIPKIINLLDMIWRKNPDLRLCQLIGNCFGPQDLYHIEDKMLEKKLRENYIENGKIKKF